MGDLDFETIGCSSIYAYYVPWVGRNLDLDSKRSNDSTQFYNLVTNQGYYQKARNFCSSMGYRDAHGWPLIIWKYNWHK